MTICHHAVLVLFWLVLGSCIGSFLNVCIHRIPRGMSLLRPRSRCPACGATILARHNLPILGWLILGGRCRECRGPIPSRYPAVELGVGVLFALPYIVAVTMCAGDPWERIGPAPLLGLLAASWTISGFGVFAMLLGRDNQAALTERRAAGGCAGPASIAPHSPVDRD
jgi:prepilin signal peptidase PulO-like enzyme (type II secretory pathway)